MVQLILGTLPVDSGDNPYITLLHEALRDRDVDVRPVDFHPRRLTRSFDADVVHLHWPEYILVGSGRGLRHRARAWAAAVAVRTGVRRLQRRAIRVVWTVHNLRPHSPSTPRSQVRLYRWLAAHADTVIVHSDQAAELLASRLRRSSDVHVVPHGHYIGAYPPPSIAREDMRRRLGIDPAEPVLLAFGQIRAYKRLVELATDVVRSDSAARLVIAGHPTEPDVAASLAEMAAQDPRIVLLARRIPAGEVADLYGAADLAVLNYAEVFSSGSLLLALSMGVATLVPPGDHGDIRAPAVFGWANSPLDALATGLGVSAAERREAALAAARAFDWDRVAVQHLDAFEGRQAPPSSSAQR